MYQVKFWWLNTNFEEQTQNFDLKKKLNSFYGRLTLKLREFLYQFPDPRPKLKKIDEMSLFSRKTKPLPTKWHFSSCLQSAASRLIAAILCTNLVLIWRERSLDSPTVIDVMEGFSVNEWPPCQGSAPPTEATQPVLPPRCLPRLDVAVCRSSGRTANRPN